MTSNVIFFAGLALFDGVAVAWAVWEFWSARPAQKPNAEEPSSTPANSTEIPRHSKRQHGPHDRRS
jgi:hypothetical protein